MLPILHTYLQQNLNLIATLIYKFIWETSKKGEFAVIDSSIFRIKADLIVIKNVFKDEIHTIKQGLKHADEIKWANEIKQVKD